MKILLTVSVLALALSPAASQIHFHFKIDSNQDGNICSLVKAKLGIIQPFGEDALWTSREVLTVTDGVSVSSAPSGLLADILALTATQYVS